jgi:hypothetical protein
MIREYAKCDDETFDYKTKAIVRALGEYGITVVIPNRVDVYHGAKPLFNGFPAPSQLLTKND